MKPCRKSRRKWRIFVPCAGPSFCSMQITQEIRDYAAKLNMDEKEARRRGMEEKSMEFKRGASSLYR